MILEWGNFTVMLKISRLQEVLWIMQACQFHTPFHRNEWISRYNHILGHHRQSWSNSPRQQYINLPLWGRAICTLVCLWPACAEYKEDRGDGIWVGICGGSQASDHVQITHCSGLSIQVPLQCILITHLAGGYVMQFLGTLEVVRVKQKMVQLFYNTRISSAIG